MTSLESPCILIVVDICSRLATLMHYNTINPGYRIWTALSMGPERTFSIFKNIFLDLTDLHIFSIIILTNKSSFVGYRNGAS